MSSSEHEEMATSKTELESGYASASSSSPSFPLVHLTPSHLTFLNNTLANLPPQDILKWALLTVPNLYQTTALGLSGLVTMDMLSKINLPNRKVPAIFLDTLHHFSETLDLLDSIKSHYPRLTIHVYKPLHCESADEFAAMHGPELWKTNEQLYDYVAKVEPAQRAYSELNVAAVLTGRRRSQGAARSSLPVIEIDEAGLLKLNPLANWSFSQVWAYIKEHDVPYNALVDRGYKSVGDWHSTEKVNDSDGERGGRWKGREKTECGIHNPRSKYARFLREMQMKESMEEGVRKRLEGVQLAQSGSQEQPQETQQL
ncbi:MAG: hypothetical protein M1834_003375 [Cirrosporium novae-zelandiae]|nr:MAG: hypothetical protein M1834_003375 [Cirrosporium novae-zelandiae]